MLLALEQRSRRLYVENSRGPAGVPHHQVPLLFGEPSVRFSAVPLGVDAIDGWKPLVEGVASERRGVGDARRLIAWRVKLVELRPGDQIPHSNNNANVQQ